MCCRWLGCCRLLLKEGLVRTLAIMFGVSAALSAAPMVHAGEDLKNKFLDISVGSVNIKGLGDATFGRRVTFGAQLPFSIGHTQKLDFEFFYYDLGTREFLNPITYEDFEFALAGELDWASVGTGLIYKMQPYPFVSLWVKGGVTQHRIKVITVDNIVVSDTDQIPVTGQDAIDALNASGIDSSEATETPVGFYYGIGADYQFSNDLSFSLSFLAAPLEIDSFFSTYDTTKVQFGLRYILGDNNQKGGRNRLQTTKQSSPVFRWEGNPWRHDISISAGLSIDEYARGNLGDTAPGFSISVAKQFKPRLWGILDLDIGGTATGGLGVLGDSTELVEELLQEIDSVATYKHTYQVSSLGAALKYVFMMGKNSHSYIKIGARKWNAQEVQTGESEVFAGLGATIVGFENDRTGTDIVYGLGVDVGLSSRMALYFEYIMKPLTFERAEDNTSLSGAIGDNIVLEDTYRRDTGSVVVGIRFMLGEGKSMPVIQRTDYHDVNTQVDPDVILDEEVEVEDNSIYQKESSEPNYKYEELIEIDKKTSQFEDDSQYDYEQRNDASQPKSSNGKFDYDKQIEEDRVRRKEAEKAYERQAF